MRLLTTDSPWYAIRLFTTRQGEVKSYFEGQGFECFIPMQYVGAEGHDGRTHRTLRPVVNNLIFVKQSDEETPSGVLFSKPIIRLVFFERLKIPGNIALSLIVRCMNFG